MNSGSTHKNMQQDGTIDPSQVALEAMDEGIAVFDRDMRLLHCNQSYIDTFPRIRGLIVPGVHWDDILRAAVEQGEIVDPFNDADAFMNRAYGHRNNHERETVAEHFDGRTYRLQFKPTPSGGYVTVRREIKDQSPDKIMIRDRETLVATVLDTSPVAVVMARLDDGRILYRSKEARTLFGDTTYAREHYISKEARDGYVSVLKQKGTVTGYRLTSVRADGSTFESESAGRIVEYLGQTCVVTAVIDITEQMEREALIRHVVESCPTPIQMTNAETGEILFSSPKATELFGEVDTSKSAYVSRDDRQRQLKTLRENGVIYDFRAEFYDQNGNRFWGLVAAQLINYAGNEVIVSHTYDLTEQLNVEAELSGQRDLLFQNEKMSALGELLAGVAHELNNPLSIVVGHSLMLREDTNDPGITRQIEKISLAAERCAKIVKTFLTMARQQPTKTEEANINDIVGTAVDVARYGDLGNEVTIDCDLSDNLPHCLADSDQITQVVLNLILNAEHAIRDSGKGDRIIVSTKFDKTADMILIEIEDNGPGIPESHQSRIFEPFYTTKEVGDGTGIGLTLSHRIIRSHEGQIKLDKTFTSGTRFQIALPSDKLQRESVKKGQSIVPVNEAKIRILIVDDEVDVADLNAEILTRDGFQVDVANKALDGVAMMHEGKYNIVLSDLNMPEMDGRGFFDTVAKEFPHLINGIGFVTGDTMGKSSQSFLKEANFPYLEKPASPKELRAFVAELLSQAEATK